jgi:RNA polymerase sigma factor (sigma-70 family)
VDQLADREYWFFIWEKFRTGDRRAFETIYNEYVNVLFSYGCRITDDRALLHDSIQDLFINIYTYSNSLRKPESIEFYLFKTLRNIIYRKLKDKSRYTHPEQMSEQFNLKFSLEESAINEQEENLKILQKELQNLDSQKRELLFLKFNTGLTYNELGKLLTINPDAAKKKVYRILKFLRKKMDEKIIGLFLMIR